jgi:nicotinate-nucleotide adenylyltransferase
MGGTFDPIHHGHLAAAEAVRHRFGIDRVVLMPAGRPPHKDSDAVTQSEDRYLMTALAAAGNPLFDVSRMELDRPGASYTVDTVKEVMAMCQRKAKIYLISGADTVEHIKSWKNPQELLSLCSVAVVSRPGYSFKSLHSNIKHLKDEYGAKIYLIEMPALGISSTEIRDRVLKRLPIKYLVPESVEQYIAKQGLYRINDSILDEAELMVQSSLSEKRWRHTLGVIQESLSLARAYGADQYKAYVAALFHDCSKEMANDDKLKFCAEANIKVDDIMKKQPDLLHSFISAEIARRDYSVKDKEILNAIRYHTTGRKEMTLLDKILLLADCIEPYREDYGHLEEMKAEAYSNLNKAVVICLESKLEYTKKKNKPVHPLSLEAMDGLRGL